MSFVFRLESKLRLRRWPIIIESSPIETRPRLLFTKSSSDKKEFFPLENVLFPQKVHEARPFQRLNVYPTCPKCARNAPRGCLTPWNLRFRLLDSRKKRKKKKKRVEFHFDEQATRESRVSCRFSREKYTHRSILFITHPGENYPRRGRKEKAWENSGELDKWFSRVRKLSWQSISPTTK